VPRISLFVARPGRVREQGGLGDFVGPDLTLGRTFG
jgi:hypothetical protein